MNKGMSLGLRGFGARSANELREARLFWSRLMGDILARRLDRPVFTWGKASLVDAGENRTAYIAALKQADNYNIGPLLALARI